MRRATHAPQTEVLLNEILLKDSNVFIGDADMQELEISRDKIRLTGLEPKQVTIAMMLMFVVAMFTVSLWFVVALSQEEGVSAETQPTSITVFVSDSNDTTLTKTSGD